MARWTDLAAWQGPTVNEGDGDGRPGEPEDRMTARMGMVEHIAEGTYDGTLAWERNPVAQVSSHFVVAKDGRIAQMVDTDDRSWCQADGNAGWISVENEGHVTDQPTPPQIEANAKLYARGMREYGWPARVTDSPVDRGLGWHGMGGAGWGGHYQCPGEGFKAARPAIVARAQQILAGVAPAPTEGDRMIIFAKDAAGQVYRCDGISCVPVPADEVINQTYVYAGLGPWAAVGARASSVGPVYPTAQGTPLAHLKIYDMGFFGQPAVVIHDGGPGVLVNHHHEGGTTGPAVAEQG